MSTITSSDLKVILERNPGIHLIDVRTREEFDEFHVAGATCVPLDTLSPEELSRARPAEEPVYILCRSGARAKKAADRLTDAGFADPVVVEGGTLAWIEAGHPVERL